MNIFSNKIKEHNYLIVILLFFLAEILINPIGEFPLNDDWAYSKTVETYLSTGVLKFSAWQAVPMLTQYLTAITFCKIFGFSFTALRFVSLISSVVIIISFNQILKKTQLSSKSKFIALMVLVFNPIFLSLSNTFMPDVFLLMLTLIGFLFLLKTIQNTSVINLLLFCFFSVAATLVRQTGILLPLSFAIVYVFVFPFSIKNISIGLLPILITVFALVLFSILSKSLWETPESFNYQLNKISNVVLHPTINAFKSFSFYIITSSIALGLMLLPLTVSNFKTHYLQSKNYLPFKIVIVSYLSLVLFKILFSENSLPNVGNLLHHMGIGPVILNGFSTQEVPVYSSAWKIILLTLNVLGGLSFAGFFVEICTKIKLEKIKKKKFVFYFIPIFVILYILPLSLSFLNDRYLLYIFPFLILIYFLSFKIEIKKSLFLITFLPIAFYSIAGTHDYLSINRKRWEITNHLMKDLKIPATEIDGGFEFNGWYLFNLNTYHKGHTGQWWWVQNDSFVVSPKLIEGYKKVSVHEFSNWISFDFNELYLLKKQDSNTNP